MGTYESFDFSQLSNEQERLIVEALDSTDFPWNWLGVNIKFGQYVPSGRNKILVRFRDLSRFGETPTSDLIHAAEHDLLEQPHAGLNLQFSSDHNHSGDRLTHAHVEEDGVGAHAVGYRNAVMGLAWYSGIVDVEKELLTESPSLAKMVFLAEGAHMTDFFYLSPDQRGRIYDAYVDDDYGDTDVGWFEELGNQDYWKFIGEHYMVGFIEAFTSKDVRWGFEYETTSNIAQSIREIVSDPRWPQVFGVEGSDVYHDEHIGVPLDLVWETSERAREDGRRPCKVCVPDETQGYADPSQRKDNTVEDIHEDVG